MRNSRTTPSLVLLALIVTQFPISGQCTSEGGRPPKELFELKGKNMKEVATEIAQLPEKGGFNVWGLDFSPDGKYLASTSPSSHEIHIWDWQNRRIVRILEKVQGSSNVTATEPIRYSPDGHLLATCHRRALGNIVIRVWNVDTGAVIRDIDTPEGGSCDAIGFTPDGKSFVWISLRPSGNQLMVHNMTTWQPIWGLRTLPFYPTTLAISPDGKFVALGGHTAGAGVSDQHQILIVELPLRAVVLTIQAFPPIQGFPLENTIQRLAWSPDGKRIAAGARVGGPNSGPDAVRIFDTQSGQLVVSEPAEQARIWALRYTSDGKYMIESAFGALAGTSLGQRRELLRIDPLPRVGEPAIRIWDGQHRRLLQEIPGTAGSIAITREGRYFAMGGDEMIFVFRLR